MKKKFLTVVFILAAVSAVIIIAWNMKGKAKETGSVKASEDQYIAKVEHGRYLANHVSICLDCHSKKDINKFSLPVLPGTEGGGAAFPFGESDGVPGEITPPNITPYALKDWSDEEIARAMTQGINKKGDTLLPMMPYHNYSRMAKEDVYAIIAYLRTMKPVENITPPRKLMISPYMFGPLPPNNLDQNIKPNPEDKVKYGEYLVTLASCADCHTQRTPQGAPDFSRTFAGGFTFSTPFFKVSVSNITPDSATGIGSWTEEAFVQRFRNNSSEAVVNMNPGKFNTTMPWSVYGKMKDDDLRAIYAYLKTVTPVWNKVEKWPTK